MSEQTFTAYVRKLATGMDGNFSFVCPTCGSYAIGTHKKDLGILLASCNGCGHRVREKREHEIKIKKGA